MDPGDRQRWGRFVGTAVISVATMVVGAAIAHQPLAIAAGVMFAIETAMTGWYFVRRAAELDDGDAIAARFARLMAVTWAWAGAAMLACYYLTELSWQHAWQYGAAMLLIAGAVWTYAGARAVRDGRVTGAGPERMARWATGAQGAVALFGVGVLVMSGKLQPDKADWAANIVFIAGGLAVFAVSMAALRAERAVA